MSTNATITVKTGECVKTIYLHYDGDTAIAGKILLRHYNSQAKADVLVALGNLSMLGVSPECPEGHTFNNPVDHFCVAYGRDRGTVAQAASLHSCHEVAMRDLQNQYNYYWDGDCWFVNNIKLTDSAIFNDKCRAAS